MVKGPLPVMFVTESVPVSVAQVISVSVMVNCGPPMSLMFTDAVSVHPFASVTVTVYVVAVVGFTVMAAVVAPVLQRKDTPPDAVSVVEPPTQMDGLEGVMTQVGGGFTITVTEQDDVHPLSASVTVTV